MTLPADPTLARRALELVADLVGADSQSVELRLAELDRREPALAAEVRSLLVAVADSDDFLAEPLIEPLPVEALPSRVGPFEVVGPIARGGSGVVVHARRTEPFRQEVAIKLMRRGLPATERARFEDERRHLAQIEHPNVARIIDGGELPDGEPYLAEELVRGVPIDDFCAARRLAVEQRLDLFRAVLDGVAAVHAAGIVHGDLKPDNLLVDDGGRPRIVDFGISQLAGAGEPARRYTPGFASPELVDGAPPTVASDIFALGTTLARLLDGAPARRRLPKPLGALRRRDAAELVAHATAAAPERRYRSVVELSAAVDALRRLRPVPAPGEPARRFALRIPRRVASLAALAGVVLLGAGVASAALLDALAARREGRRAGEADRLCGDLLAALDPALQRPAEAALGGGELAAALAALDRFAGESSRTASQPRAAARGCAAFGRFDLRRASRELAPLATGAHATPRLRALYAETLSDLDRLDQESLSRLYTGAERSAGAADRMERVNGAELVRALEAVEADAGGDPLVLVRLALARNRNLEAHRLARQRAAARAGDAAAHRLEAEAALQLARISAAPAVGDWLEVARAATAAGLAVAPSDPRLHLLDCRRRELRLDLANNQLAPSPLAPSELVRSAEPCATAERLAPALTDAALAHAWLRYQTVRALADSDPSEELARLADAAGRASALAPDDAASSLVRGLAVNATIGWALRQRREPAELERQARTATAETERLAGRTARTLRLLAAVEAQLAAWTAGTGADSAPRFAAARALYAEALARSPSDLVSLAGLGWVELRRVDVDLLAGRDPTAAVADVVAVAGRVLTISPQNALARIRRAGARLALVEWRLVRGEPTADLELALADDLEPLGRVLPPPRALVGLRLQAAQVRAVRALEAGEPAARAIDAATAAALAQLGTSMPDDDERLALAALELTGAAEPGSRPERIDRALTLLAPIAPTSERAAQAALLRGVAHWLAATAPSTPPARRHERLVRAASEIADSRSANPSLARAKLWQAVVAAGLADLDRDGAARSGALAALAGALGAGRSLPTSDPLGGTICRRSARAYWAPSFCALPVGASAGAPSAR